jgi:hypothetical protein
MATSGPADQPFWRISWGLAEPGGGERKFTTLKFESDQNLTPPERFVKREFYLTKI